MFTLLMSSLSLGEKLSPSKVVTSCSRLPDSSEWNKRDVAAHLKSWLTGLVTLRSLSLHHNTTLFIWSFLSFLEFLFLGAVLKPEFSWICSGRSPPIAFQ